MAFNYPMIYYRTPATKQTLSSYATPLLMLQNAPAQCIVFQRPNSSLDTITYTYNNNINYFAGISNDGTRVINIQDNGIDSATLVLSGVFTVSNGGFDIANLQNSFAGQLNTDSIHTRGNIGFYSPNATFFSQDAYALTGYSLKTFNVIRSTKIPNLYSFSITLGFGG